MKLWTAMLLLTSWKGTQDLILATCAGKLEICLVPLHPMTAQTTLLVRIKTASHWLFQSNTLGGPANKAVTKIESSQTVLEMNPSFSEILIYIYKMLRYVSVQDSAVSELQEQNRTY
jgi:hypothetical protein